MKIKDFDCPSCGASLKVEKGEKSLTCPYCDSTVIVPDALYEADDSGWTPVTQSVRSTVVLNGSSVKRSCSGAIVSLVVFLIAISASIIFWITRSAEVKEAIQGQVTQITGGGISRVMEFGGDGMRAGYFQDAAHLCGDRAGNIYVAENSSGTIQVFDGSGNYLYQWDAAKSDDVYIRGMDISPDGERLYLIYDGEIYIHDPNSGDISGQLQHPDGWGFDDLAVCDDGSVVASWYCNRDDIVKFAPDGSLEFVIREAISGQSGDSELDTSIGVDGDGNMFAFGSFNESFFKFSPSGRFLDRFGREGDHPGGLTSPSSFCIDQMGRVWVSDFGDLIIFDNDGTYLATLDPGTTLEDMYMADDYQLFGLTHENTVIQFNLSTEASEL